jgi:hypothetical protein
MMINSCEEGVMIDSCEEKDGGTRKSVIECMVCDSEGMIALRRQKKNRDADNTEYRGVEKKNIKKKT